MENGAESFPGRASFRMEWGQLLAGKNEMEMAAGMEELRMDGRLAGGVSARLVTTTYHTRLYSCCM